MRTIIFTIGLLLLLIFTNQAAGYGEDGTYFVLFSQEASKNAKNIVIDGNPDDWDGIEPIAIGIEGKEFFDVQGSDIKELYAVKDNEHLFVMLTLYDPPANLKMPDRDSGYDVIISADDSAINNMDNLSRSDCNYYEIRLWSGEDNTEAEPIRIWYWDKQIQDRDRLDDLYPDRNSAVGEVVEMKIPLEAIGNPEKFIIMSDVHLSGTKPLNNHYGTSESSTLTKIIKTITEIFKEHTAVSFVSLIAIIGIVGAGYGYARKRD